MKYVTAFVLYVIFSIAAALAGVIGLLVLPFRPQYTANVMHTMDMLLAALFGWDGRSTVSKECGRELLGGEPCRFCRWVCALTHRLLEKGHCEKEAAR